MKWFAAFICFLNLQTYAALPECRGLLIGPDPKARELSDDEVLRLAAEWLNISTFYRNDWSQPTLQVIVVGPKPELKNETKQIQVLDELLTRHPNILLAVSSPPEEFTAARNHWLSGLKPRDRRERKLFSYFNQWKDKRAPLGAVAASRELAEKNQAFFVTNVPGAGAEPIYLKVDWSPFKKRLVGAAPILAFVPLSLAIRLYHGLTIHPLHNLGSGLVTLGALLLVIPLARGLYLALQSGRLAGPDVKALAERIDELNQTHIPLTGNELRVLLVVTDDPDLPATLREEFP